MEILSLQDLRRSLQRSKRKVFVFLSEMQPGHKSSAPIGIKMLCWFSEVWPQTNTIVMQSTSGEICFKQVKYVVEHTESVLGEAIYTIHCGGTNGGQTSNSVFELIEYQ